MIGYTLKMVDGILVVSGSNGQVLPLELLDQHRMVSNPDLIGRRYWNEMWQDWSYEIVNVEPGTDVTGFIGGE